MTTLNRPDRVTLDAYNDKSLTYGGPYYSQFTNRLTTPILNAKGIQLLNINYVNSVLELNDASQLMFFYYASGSTGNFVDPDNLHVIRLHPSTFVPYAGYTTFVRNKYFTSVPDLVTALNLAASATGDSATFNPRFTAGQVTFSYDTATRKISIVGNGSEYIAPAAADDPNVLALLASASLAPRMNVVTSSNTYATAKIQPFVRNFSMNARLGFCLGYGSRGLFWGGTSQVGCANSTGLPTLSTPMEADAWPILLGAQNIQVYCSIVAGSGMDSLNRKNLAASVPVEVGPLHVGSYTLNSINAPLLSVPSEVYEIGIDLRDENGIPFPTPLNYNVELSFMILY
jgi:hypothetical protein